MHTSLENLLTAAGPFVALVADERVAATWADRSAVDGYTVGGLVAHVAAGLSWLTSLADRPVDGDGTLLTSAGYLRMACTDVGGPAAAAVHAGLVADANRRADKGALAGRAHLDDVVRRLHDTISTADPDARLDLRPVLPAGIRLADFARTRTVEVVVHADDLVAGCEGLRHDLDPAVAADAADALLQTACLIHGDVPVLRGLARGERADGVFPVI